MGSLSSAIVYIDKTSDRKKKNLVLLIHYYTHTYIYICCDLGISPPRHFWVIGLQLRPAVKVRLSVDLWRIFSLFKRRPVTAPCTPVLGIFLGSVHRDNWLFFFFFFFTTRSPAHTTKTANIGDIINTHAYYTHYIIILYRYECNTRAKAKNHLARYSVHWHYYIVRMSNCVYKQVKISTEFCAHNIVRW